ncbi:MAG: class I SAM-dependent methyltransferase [Candidatus Bathyarchaeota archaeon]
MRGYTIVTTHEENDTHSIHIEYNTIRTKQYQHYLSYIPEDTQTVLDIGFGRGEFLQTLQGKGYTVSGCDIDENLVKWGQENGLNVKVEGAETLTRTYENDSHDLITCLHVLEHLDSPIVALREFHKVTGRHMLVAVPNAYAKLPDIGSHLYSFNYQTLTNLARRADFKPEHVTGESINIWPNVIRFSPGVNRLIIGLLYGSNEIVGLFRKI